MVQVDLKCDLRSHYLIMILLIVAFTCSQLYSFMNETQQHSLALEQHVKQLASNLNQNANPSDLRLAEANGNRSPKQLALEKVAKRMDRYTLATTGKPDHITHKDCEEYAIDIGASFGQNLYNPGPGCVVTADFANVRYNPGECQHEHAAACDCSPNNQCINNPKTSNNFKSPTVKKWQFRNRYLLKTANKTKKNDQQLRKMYLLKSYLVLVFWHYNKSIKNSPKTIRRCQNKPVCNLIYAIHSNMGGRRARLPTYENGCA